MTAVSLSFLALARWDWMTADEIVAACAMLIMELALLVMTKERAVGLGPARISPQAPSRWPA